MVRDLEVCIYTHGYTRIPDIYVGTSKQAHAPNNLRLHEKPYTLSQSECEQNGEM
jgi:hypothetical protein